MQVQIVIILAIIVGLGSAQLQVTNPTGSNWWVAKSENVLTWSCQNSQYQTFTIVIANKNPSILPAPMAIISEVNNYDCGKLVTQDQANQPAGQGYTILLADPVNITNIYTTSEEFEIKPLGAAYPATSVAATGTAKVSGSGAAGPTNSKGAQKGSANGGPNASYLGLSVILVGTILSMMI